MRLVADALQQLERAAVVRQAQRLAFSWQENLLTLFGEADDRQFVQAQLAEFPHGHAELAFATVHDDEVWQKDFRASVTRQAAQRFQWVFLGKFSPGCGGAVF